MDNVKRVIIVGANGTLGTELCKLFIDKRYEVIGLSRSYPISDVTWIHTDLTLEGSIEDSLAYIKRECPKFEHIINCGGVFSLKPISKLDYKEMENLFRVNLMAPMKVVSGLMKLIKKNEADIVNIGSSISYKAVDGHSLYGASKWGLRGYTKHLQLELEKTKSRVIYFSPAGFKSGLFKKAKAKMDMRTYMDAKDLAGLLLSILELPKSMEVSDILINRNCKK